MYGWREERKTGLTHLISTIKEEVHNEITSYDLKPNSLSIQTNCITQSITEVVGGGGIPDYNCTSIILLNKVTPTTDGEHILTRTDTSFDC